MSLHPALPPVGAGLDLVLAWDPVEDLLRTEPPVLALGVGWILLGGAEDLAPGRLNAPGWRDSVVAALK